ncbi:MAG: formate dehydrogenase subunit gamma [Beijerinckiaceae bacterium]|nr:formate dehydrogenase subunit gamma [Beijerinckiaceae bacterium]
MMNLRSAVFAIALAATCGVAASPLRAQAQPAPQAQTTPEAAQPPQQQVQVPPPPPRQSVTEDMLLRENDRIIGRVSIPDTRLAFLEQPQGRTWRRFNETWAPWILGLSVILPLLALLLLYMFRGAQRYERDASPIYVIRYSAFERFNHWMTATSFVILALTGLNYVFGKRLLMPLMSPGTFGDFSQIAKYAHNFFAWPFILGVLVMIVVWTRDNLPRRVDLAWLRAGGGLFKDTTHLSAGRFNAGQKLLFWAVVLATLVTFGSGLALMFPLMFLDVNGMQLWGSIHSIAAALFIALIIGHIYIGTAGTEGSFGGMGSGEVDLAWARHHHDLWAEDAPRADPREDALPQPGHVSPPPHRT